MTESDSSGDANDGRSPGTPEQTFSLDPPPAESEDTQPGGEIIRGRSALVIIGLMVLLADLTIYHAAGFAGPAAFFVGAIVLLFIGIPKRSINIVSALLTVMLTVISWRLLCNGSSLQIIVGFWLLHALVLVLRRQVPYVLETCVFAAQSVPGGYQFLSAVNQQLRERVLKRVDEGKSSHLLNIGLPVGSALLFGGIFVMANPDIVSWVSERLSDLAERLRQFLFQFSPFEIGFWGIVAWLTGGLLRPVISAIIDEDHGRDSSAWGVEKSPLFDAFRNTLVTVIALFVVYLTFEIRTLWLRTIPPGFHYSGYAHQGAAWLTVALALATLMLSLIFRGRTLCDPRLRRLQGLAWFWSALNLILALAVYHRMLIYIDFNGMTRMRIVGLLGITSVVGGFALVLIKIIRRTSFLWLIRRQLWVVGAAVLLFVVLPVDVLIHRYNVRQILAGNHAPVVQITEHPVDDEALPILLPLCQAPDERIRSGIQAMLQRRLVLLQDRQLENAAAGWTAWQKSTVDSRVALETAKTDWPPFESTEARESAWKTLKDFAYANWW